MPVYQQIWAGPARVYRKDSAGRPVLSRKKYITIHNTSNDASAEGEAAYAKVRTNASSHYYCDHDSLLQSLDTDWCAGHVGSTEGNTFGISYEITGVNSWTREQWLANVAWDLLAKQVAIDCAHFGIPVRWLSVAEMKTKSQSGFITHNDARLAWGGTTHTDPGPGFPMDHLMGLVAAILNGDNDMDIEQLQVAPWQYRNAAGVADWAKNRPNEWYPDMHHVVWDTYRRVQALEGRDLSDEQLDKLADKVAARMPKPPTAKEIADLIAARMAS